MTIQTKPCTGGCGKLVADEGQYGFICWACWSERNRKTRTRQPIGALEALQQIVSTSRGRQDSSLFVEHRECLEIARAGLAGAHQAPEPEGLDLEADIAKMDALMADICHNGGQYSAEHEEWCEVNKALWKSLRGRLRAGAEGGGT